MSQERTPIRVVKTVNYDERGVEVRLPSGNLALMTEAEARELYARLEWVVKDRLILLADTLERLLVDRGSDVQEWPKDEQNFFRGVDISEHSFDTRREMLHKYRMRKLAGQLINEGWTHSSS